MKEPLDRFPYPRDPRSRPARPGLTNGGYVYVRDLRGEVHVLPDGPHRHPKVLGNAEPAMYAGDLTIRDGQVLDMTNLSGTFRCDDIEGLLEVADELLRLGFAIQPYAIRFFPWDGSRPIILR